MAHGRTFGSGTFGKTARMLAGASLLAMAVIAIPGAGGQAHAAQNNGGGVPAGKACAHPEKSGQTLPAGTVWTSTTQNGQVASKYKCNGSSGQWDRMRVSTAPSTPKAPTTGTKKAF